MKRGVILFIILLLINATFVSSLGDFQSSQCDGSYGMSYTLLGGGPFEITCQDIINDYIGDADLCKNEVTLQDALRQNGGIFRNYVDEGFDDFDYNIYYYPQDKDYISNLNPCDKCGTYFDGLYPSCKGYSIGDTRHCQGYPNVGRCAAATEEYLGVEYVINTYGYNRLFAEDAPELLWNSCSYIWDANTQEICGNNKDDDCNGSVDEGCQEECQTLYESCEVEVCCAGLSCENGGPNLGDICIDCLDEGDACTNKLFCCGAGLTDGYCGSGHCCDAGDAWNPETGECERQAECYETIECPISPVDNFVQWLITPGCFRNALSIIGQEQYTQSCCPADLYGGEGWYYTDIVVS